MMHSSSRNRHLVALTPLAFAFAALSAQAATRVEWNQRSMKGSRAIVHVAAPCAGADGCAAAGLHANNAMTATSSVTVVRRQGRISRTSVSRRPQRYGRPLRVRIGGCLKGCQAGEGTHLLGNACPPE